ncbi:hypothetical protein VOI54_09540 [Tamlana sp. 2201CG12-4]|uniref:hypothetical protein n=1 Tax=Tamlana sp. 2201CG12-4 TaxID=3112582 RepID=UPI002DBC37ED|nr:hypothetical protein [Tamlana sp. 2201CG12-4]MEC3907264.1 hypothetical protein [Tamlana sp. 2201CG12-4]
MKQLVLLIFALFLTISVNAQEKKTFEGAVAHAELSKEETTKVIAINKEKITAIRVVRKKKLDKETEKTEIKALKQESNKKIKAIIGKEKFKIMQSYWKK